MKFWTPRAGGWHENEKLRPGTFVPSEVTSRWPLPNRLAMHRNGFVQFFQSEREATLTAEQLGAAIQRDPIRARVDAERNIADSRRNSLAKAREAKERKRAARDAGVEA